MRTCRSERCNAPVIFAKTASGRNMILDAAPVLNGNVVVIRGIAEVVPPHPRIKRYVPHQATCKALSEFRQSSF